MARQDRLCSTPYDALSFLRDVDSHNHLPVTQNAHEQREDLFKRLRRRKKDHGAMFGPQRLKTSFECTLVTGPAPFEKEGVAIQAGQRRCRHHCGSPWNYLNRDVSLRCRRDEQSTWIINHRHAAFRYQGNLASQAQTFQQDRHFFRGIVPIIQSQGDVNAVMSQQGLSRPRVLCRNQVDLFESSEPPNGEIVRMSDRHTHDE